MNDVFKPTLRSLLAAVTFALPALTFAWGVEGHRTVGAIADANLSAKAKSQVALLLQDDLYASGQPSGRTTLASVASWADEIRSTEQGKARASWHFRDNAACNQENDPCTDGNCIDVKLTEMLAVLRKNDADIRQRNEALKWVVHLTGDIHQPLHVAENHDHGANQIPVAVSGVKTKGQMNLHKAWDSTLVQLVLQDGEVNATLTPNFKPGAIAQWMEEGRSLSHDITYGKLNGFTCGQPSPNDIVVLDQAYQDAAKPVVRQQLIRAGLRLAALLNATFD